MSKKIIITFNSEPTPGVALDYIITVEGVNLVYANGLDHCTFQYQAFGGTDPTKCEIQNNLSLTINETLAFLNANFVAPNITYARVNNTIEVLINISESVLTYTYAVNPSLTITTTDVENINYVTLKYFFQYKNVVNDTYFCEIFKKGYNGQSQEINGKIILEKANVTNLLDSIRGGGLQLQLEATKDLTLEDLYSENEQDFKIKVYKNNKTLFYGYINPDGVYQDYVRDEWRITLDCVDGLGSLANLSFVQSNGLQFTGKMKAIDIIYNCLKRTGLLMPINTSINTLFDGLVSTDNVLTQIFLNTERFVKTDDNTIMSCEDVLKSILDIFKACITQQDGEWYIYKPNEIYIDPYVVFRRFDINNNFVGSKTVNLNKALGSQIDNFYPHHCTGNQRIEIKGSIGGFRLGYKYGFVSGLLENPSLIKNGNVLSYDGWTVDDSGSVLINDPQNNKGFLFKNFSSFLGLTADRVTSDAVLVSTGDDLTLRISFNVKSSFGSSYIRFKIQQGSYYLDYTPQNDLTPIEDTENASWSLDSSKRFTIFLTGKIGVFEIKLPKVLSDGNLTLSILGCQNLGTNSTTYIDSLDILPTQAADSPIGEFHTVSRPSNVSSAVKPNQTVYNGDNPGEVYVGAIFKEGDIPTDLWFRKNSDDKLPILRIAAEEELRISQKPTKKFIGDIFGYIPYLSLITINNIGKFMPIEWSYDTVTNVTSCKHLELFVSELSDIRYEFTLDYGETVKPTIK